MNSSGKSHLNHSSAIDTVGDSVEDPDPEPDPQDPHVLGFPDPDLLVRGTEPDPDPSLFS